MRPSHTLNFQHDCFTRASTGSRHITVTAAAPNIPPSISIITPADNSSVTLPATVTIAANATDSDGTISKVDFYSNAILMTTVTAAPYSVTLAGFNLGSYTFTAVATDNNNASTTSATVSISIVNGASQVYYIHTDQLNTPRLITDSNSAKVWEWNNDDPFGNNPANDDPNATGNHFSFNQRNTGQYFDKETGLFYNWNRFYRPDTGTYDQSDLIGLDAGINTYSYVGGNPMSYVDPLGLASLSTDMTAGTTTFDARPESPSGMPITIETRNVVDSHSTKTANDAYSTPDVNWVDRGTKSKAYGTDGSYLDTGDRNGRDIHGGGSRLKDPFLDKQGWAPTMGCTRGQNQDVRDIGLEVDRFKLEHPGVKVPYSRHW